METHATNTVLFAVGCGVALGVIGRAFAGGAHGLDVDVDMTVEHLLADAGLVEALSYLQPYSSADSGTFRLLLQNCDELARLHAASCSTRNGCCLNVQQLAQRKVIDIRANTKALLQAVIIIDRTEARAVEEFTEGLQSLAEGYLDNIMLNLSEQVGGGF